MAQPTGLRAIRAHSAPQSPAASWAAVASHTGRAPIKTTHQRAISAECSARPQVKKRTALMVGLSHQATVMKMRSSKSFIVMIAQLHMIYICMVSNIFC